jgi:hypothetical protein
LATGVQIMQQWKQWAWGVVGLSLGLAALMAFSKAGARDGPDDIEIPKDIRDSVNKMADDVGKDKKIDKDAAQFFKDHNLDLKKTMWVFKPREKDGKGGFGVGPKPDPTGTVPDGIDAWITTYGNPRRKAFTDKELAKLAPDLERLADVTRAMAEIAEQFTPKKKMAGMDPKDWKESNEKMKEWSTKLKVAIKAKKPDDVKKAFENLYSSCTDCHGVFRP